MSTFALVGALELGLIYALVGLGVFLSFRVLAFPDLTVDGSFPLGAAVAAQGIVAGVDPFLATFLAILAGGLAMLVTAILNVRFGILHLLASILTMIGLYSVILRVMGRPNLALINEPTVLTPFQDFLPGLWLRPLFAGAVVVLVALLLVRGLASDYGLAMRAVGANPRMARAQGIATGRAICAGMAISNGLVALAGALFAQTNGFADVTLGTGTIVVGLAAVIVGETLFGARTVAVAVSAVIAGAVLYRLAIALALNTRWLGLEATDLNLLTAVLVATALILGRLRAPRLARASREAAPAPSRTDA